MHGRTARVLQVQYYTWKLEQRYERNTLYKVRTLAAVDAAAPAGKLCQHAAAAAAAAADVPARPPRACTQGWAFCHDAVVAWAVAWQLLRLAQLAEALLAAMRK